MRFSLTWFEPGPCRDSCPPRVLWPDCSVTETCPPEIASSFKGQNIFLYSGPMSCFASNHEKHENVSAESYNSNKNKSKISKSAKGAFCDFTWKLIPRISSGIYSINTKKS